MWPLSCQLGSLAKDRRCFRAIKAWGLRFLVSGLGFSEFSVSGSGWKEFPMRVGACNGEVGLSAVVFYYERHITLVLGPLLAAELPSTCRVLHAKNKKRERNSNIIPWPLNPKL